MIVEQFSQGLQTVGDSIRFDSFNNLPSVLGEAAGHNINILPPLIIMYIALLASSRRRRRR